MEIERILIIVGYILAIFFPLIGVIYGLMLYFTKGDDENVKKHGIYVIIVGVVMMIISILLAMMMGISVLGMAAIA